MRLSEYLTHLTKPELDKTKDLLILTDEEGKVIDMLLKKQSLIEIADRLQVSIPTVSRRIAAINQKVERLEYMSIPITDKVTLTIEECAEYSNIGVNKLYEMTNEQNCPFVLFVGKKRLIKKKEFDKFIDRSVQI